MTPFDTLAARLAPSLAFCGIALARDRQAPAFHIATAPGLTVTPDTPYRAASISKVVTRRVFARVAEMVGWHPPYARARTTSYAANWRSTVMSGSVSIRDCAIRRLSNGSA